MAQLLEPEQWGRGPRTSETPNARPAGTEDERPPGPRRTGGDASRTRTAGDSGWDPFADEPAAGAPRQPRGGSTPPPAPPRGPSRLPLILTIVLIVLALVAGGIWAAASGLLPFGGGQSPQPETPAASAPATDAPEPSQSASAPAEPAGTALPASCDELFSGSMRGTIEGTGLVLNPEWHVAGGDTRLPSEDPELQQVLGSVERLDCAWLQESPGGVGIYTSISQVTPEQAAAAAARMTDLGYGAIEELGGVRYVTEMSGDGNTLGESHFLRDGLWFGTLWINYGPAGYTADMVTQVFG